MKKYEERRKKVEEYYQNHSLVLIGMNDYANSSFLTNSLLKLIEKEINVATLNIDAGSLTLNKSEHIDIMLGYNLTLEEIEIARLISLHDGISNFIRETFGENTQQKVDDKLLNKVFNPAFVKSPSVPNLGISDLIKQVESPIIIHSTGANNLMRILGTNPYVIEHDYKEEGKTHKYSYALMKALEKRTIPTVLDGVKRNFENIYALNPNAQIYSLGLYLQKVFKKEKFKDFKELILRYNEELEKLCCEYSVSYIETMNHGNKHENHLIDFNLSRKGQESLAKSIIEEMFLYLDMVDFKPQYKENNINPIYGSKEELIDKYDNAIWTDIMSSSYSGAYKKPKSGLLYERDREMKIYEKTFVEAYKRKD